jgi:hypothetical protein
MTRRVFRDPQIEDTVRRAGYAVVPCLDADEIELVRNGFRAIADVLRAYPFSASIMSPDYAYRDAVHALLSPAFARAMNSLLVDYRFVFGNFVVKQADQNSAVPYHQDITFVDERQFESVNFWVPIEDVAAGGGRLRVVPGSHRLNTGPRGTHRIFPYPELLQQIDQSYAVELDVPAGWAVAMNQRLFHASEPNSNGSERVVASALMVPRESDLVYLDQTRTRAGDIAVYAVDDAFYQRHVWGMPVEGRPLIEIIPASADPVTSSMLATAYETAFSDRVAVHGS